MLARQLIKACGGLVEASAVCRISRSRLSDCQNLRIGNEGGFMPIDVIAELEAYCGRPIYSAAVAAERPAQADPHTVLTEACEISEEAGVLLRVCREADGQAAITPHERRLIEAGAHAIEEQIRELRAAAAYPQRQLHLVHA